MGVCKGGLAVGAGVCEVGVPRGLSQAGLKVTVLERGAPCRNSSWAGGCILSPLYPWRYADAVNRLAAWSQASYPGLCQQLLQETGIDPEWTESGLLLLDRAEFDAARRWSTVAQQPCKELAGCDLGLSEPVLAGDHGRGVLFPQIAQVRNPRLLKALVRSLEVGGVSIIPQTEVLSLRCDAGRVRGVDSSRGPGSLDEHQPIEPVLGSRIERKSFSSVWIAVFI